MLYEYHVIHTAFGIIRCRSWNVLPADKGFRLYSIFSSLNGLWRKESGFCGDNEEPSASISFSLGSCSYVYDLLQS